MTDTDQLTAIEKRAEGLTDLCEEYLRQSVRHVQRNCDIDCNTHGEDDGGGSCKQPDRYDGGRMAAALADIPTLLDLARKQQAAIDALLYVADNKAADNMIGRWWAGVIKGTIHSHMNPALEAKP